MKQIPDRPKGPDAPSSLEGSKLETSPHLGM